MLSGCVLWVSSLWEWSISSGSCSTTPLMKQPLPFHHYLNISLSHQYLTTISRSHQYLTNISPVSQAPYPTVLSLAAPQLNSLSPISARSLALQPLRGIKSLPRTFIRIRIKWACNQGKSTEGKEENLPKKGEEKNWEKKRGKGLRKKAKERTEKRGEGKNWEDVQTRKLLRAPIPMWLNVYIHFKI